MTFFLRDGKPQPFDARGPDLAPQDTFGAIGAGFGLSQLEYNANFRANREDAAERRNVIDQFFPKLTDDEIAEYVKSSHGDMFEPTRDVARAMARGDSGAGLLDLARRLAEENPERFEGIDLSDEGMKARVDAKLQAEHKMHSDVMSMSGPFARTVGGFVGGASGLVVDARNIPFMLLGGGATLLRRIGAAAATNVAAEAAFLPSAFEMAERLQIPDPDIAETLLLAAVGGAAIQGGIEGAVVAGRAISRGLAYARARDAHYPPLPGYDEASSRIAQDAAEDAMSSRGTDPIEAMREALMDAPPPRPEPTGEPLIPDVEPPAARVPEPQAEPTPLEQLPQTADAIETTTLPPMEGEAPRSDSELVAMAERAIERSDDPAADAARALADAADEIDGEVFRGTRGQVRFPLLRELKRLGIKINPDSPEGQELYSIFGGAREANRTVPGLFSRKGRSEQGLDNIVASEIEGSFPGISDAAGVENGYLTVQGIFDLIRRETAGDWSWDARVSQAQSIRSQALDIEAASARSEIIEDFRSQAPTDGGFHVPKRDFWGPDETSWMAAQFDRWAEQKGYNLLEREREEILWQLRKDGGDAEYLVERAFERELSDADMELLGPARSATDEYPPPPFGDEAPGEVLGAGRQTALDAEPDGRTAESGPEGPGRDGDFATERTDAGEQFIFPGTARVDAAAGMTQRQRAEMQARAQQSMIRRGDQSRVEADEGSLFGAGAQKDIFDEPTGPKAKIAQDEILNDLSDDMFRGLQDPDTGAWVGPVDFDGRPIRSADEARQYIADMDEFSAMLDLCGRPKK
jgi:hypothetical protein